jgi:hypothetical protein
MPRTCTVCTHPERQTIDKALAAGETHRDLVAEYRVSKDALSRHNATHVPPAVAKAQQAEDVQQALDVLSQLKAINGTCLQILSDARRAGDTSTALKAADRVLRQLEFQARLLGEIDDRPQVNILISAEWTGVREALLAALRPYPEARLAVAGALAQLETSA